MQRNSQDRPQAARRKQVLRDDSLEKVDLESGHGLSNESNEHGGCRKAQTADEKRKEWIRTSPDSPRNWPTWRKWWIMSGLMFFTFVVFISSTGFVTDWAEERFGVGLEVSILGQSIYILGVAIGVSNIGSTDTQH